MSWISALHNSAQEAALTVRDPGHSIHGHPGPCPDGGQGVAVLAGPSKDTEVAAGGRGGGENPGDDGDVHDEEQLPVHHSRYLLPRTPTKEVLLPVRRQSVITYKMKC